MKNTNPHIVQYQGSKRKLAPQILPFFPKKFDRMIEPFAGMAAMSIAIAAEGRCNKFVINDINTPLLSILEEGIQNPSRLVEQYSSIWKEQFVYTEGTEAHYYYIRDRFNNGQKDAATMLYLLARCVKGAIRYGSAGNFNQSPDKRRNGTSPENLAYNLTRISLLLKDHCVFKSCDYRTIIENAHKGDVVYMDPPYQGVCTRRDSRYFSGINHDEFVESLYILNEKKVDYIISYDGSCGDKTYGKDLPATLGLKKLYLNAGLSTQELFNGRNSSTKEALYLSPGLISNGEAPSTQLQLF